METKVKAIILTHGHDQDKNECSKYLWRSICAWNKHENIEEIGVD